MVKSGQFLLENFRKTSETDPIWSKMASFWSKITDKVRNRTENGQKSTEIQFFWNFLKFSLLDSETDSISSFTTSFKLFFQTSVKSFKHFCCVRHKFGSSWLVSDFLPKILFLSKKTFFSKIRFYFNFGENFDFLKILEIFRWKKVWNNPSS